MPRREFTTKTQREAFKRSGMRCEAVGVWYGLDAGQRCGADLAYGVEYDHIILDANSKDNSLENCAAVCIKCHRHKTAKHDTPTAAKTKRQSEMGVVHRQKAKIAAPPKPVKAKRDQLEMPPRRSVYESARTASGD